MLVTLAGIVEFLHPIINVLVNVSIIALQPLRESNTVFPSSTVIDAILEQPEKTFLPMLVTLAGMVMDVRLEQYWKALLL